MKKIIIIYAAVLIELCFGGMVKGFVTDLGENPMPGTNITVIGTTLGAATDDKGYFFIKNIDPGKYIFKSSFVGYRDDILRDVKVRKDSVTVLNFYMIPVEMELQSVKVEKRKEDVIDQIYSRELGYPEVINPVQLDEGKKTPEIRIVAEIGFWEKFKYHMWKIFN